MSKTTEIKTKRVFLGLLKYNKIQKEYSSYAYKYKGEQEEKKLSELKSH